MRLGLALAFCTLTFAVYGKSLGNDFVRMDDGLLIYENQFIREISPVSLKTIFTTYDPELYIPLTFLTYQIDYQFSGLHPFGYHLTNLILHTLNALLVLWFIYLLSESGRLALFVAAVFVIHPLHTEAVAWAAGRKDLLSAAFFLGAVIAYMYYRDRLMRLEGDNPRSQGDAPLSQNGMQLQSVKTFGRVLVGRLYVGRLYGLSLLLFLLGLLSKVMVITLPAVLILLDVYHGRRVDRRMVLEKIPFFLLSVVFGIIAMFGKTAVLAESSLWIKVLVAIKSAAFYLQKIFVPYGLSIIYPYVKPVTIFSPDFFVPGIIVIALLGVMLWAGWRSLSADRHSWHRMIAFGLAWYVITLAPTFFNLIKGGEVFFASDRYAYLPSIGILTLAGWLLTHLFQSDASRSIQVQKRFIVSAGSVVVLTIFSFLTYRQSLVWAKTEDLFRNVLAFYPDSHGAHNNLANAYRRRGELDPAIEEFKKAIALKPHMKTYDNLGATYRKKGMYAEAIAAHREAMKLAPTSAEPHFGLAMVATDQGKVNLAFTELDRALVLNPEYADVYINRGALKLQRGDYDGAVEDYRKAIAINPIYGYAHYNLAVALSEHGQTDEALREYEEAVKVQPTLIIVRINLGILYASLGRLQDSRAQFEAILALDPLNATARKALMQLDAFLSSHP